jgi:hypothetical protein
MRRLVSYREVLLFSQFLHVWSLSLSYHFSSWSCFSLEGARGRQVFFLTVFISSFLGISVSVSALGLVSSMDFWISLGSGVHEHVNSVTLYVFLISHRQNLISVAYIELVGWESDNIIKTMQRSRISSQITSSKPPVYDRWIVRESYSKNSIREELAICRSVWLLCTSLHSTSMHEAYGPLYFEFQ